MNPRPDTPRPRALLRRAFALAFACVGLASHTHAATYLQVVNQSGSGSWNDLAAWNTGPGTTGTAPTAITSADDFVANTGNWVLRTPGGASTFGGRSLTVGPTNHQLLIKGGTATTSIAKLITSGSARVTGGSNSSVLAVTEYQNLSGTTALGNNSATNASYTVTIGTLTGSGDFNLTGPASGTIKLSVGNAVNYLGTFTLSTGKLEFTNAMNSSGGLVVVTPANVTLNHAVTFTALTVAGVPMPAGATYSAATLGFVGNGSVTVRTPATWYLTTNQAGSQNWTEDFLFNWNSLANGTGVVPTSINLFDNYVNQGSGREIRTPGTASTFGGGSLTLANTAKLTVKTSANLVSTIPVFITTGTPTLVNGGGNYRQNLAMGDWHVSSGSTKLSASTGRSLGFDIDHLTGSGGFQTQNGGAFFLKVRDGSGYTGTLDHASGSLRFENVVGSRGALQVGSAATVHLDQRVYFTGLTVDGVAKPAGIHTYASLHAAHPAQFPAGSAPGLVGVYAPDATGPVVMNGVNLSGPESTGGSTTPFPGTYGSQWIYPTEADFNYYQSKGLKLLRLPFRWERIQSSLTGPLVQAELDRMKTAVSRAAARDMKIILDMHNYARYRTSSGTLKFGDAGLPDSAFADVWRKLANEFKGNPGIYGYDIMNEPNGLPGGAWISAAQAAIHAIREVDLGTYIIVEGESWANAWGFETKNPQLHTVRDPVGRLIFSAHSYWSKAGTDHYLSYDEENAHPMMGVNNVKPFIDWLKKHDFKGFVGEYAVPNNDPRWLVVLDNFLAYLAQEGVSGTYWAGGAWFGGSPVSCHPTSNYTVDRPVMSVLQNHP